MPFTMKIQLIDSNFCEETRRLKLVKPMAKWRLKHFFEHQFPCVLRSSTAVPVEKIIDNDVHFDKDVAGADLESNCVCLARMVQNFMEDNHDNKHPVFVKCFCNRFNDNCEDNSDIKSDVAFGETNQPSSRETNTVFSYCAMSIMMMASGGNREGDGRQLKMMIGLKLKINGVII
ncbi:hypothetical protein HN51_028916 [Arachis hypogaea]